METLSARFREIEVTLDAPSRLPSELPATWLDPELSGAVVHFTDTGYEPVRSRDEVEQRFAGVRAIHSREMSFHSIFLALAKSRRGQCA